jgi:hypothetical protein
VYNSEKAAALLDAVYTRNFSMNPVATVFSINVEKYVSAELVTKDSSLLFHWNFSHNLVQIDYNLSLELNGHLSHVHDANFILTESLFIVSMDS